MNGEAHGFGCEAKGIEKTRGRVNVKERTRNRMSENEWIKGVLGIDE